MVLTAGGWSALVTEQVHASMCGFTSATAHPHDQAIAQCHGCRLWRYMPLGQKPSPTRQAWSLTCPGCLSSNVTDLGGYAECRECGHGFVAQGAVR